MAKQHPYRPSKQCWRRPLHDLSGILLLLDLDYVYVLTMMPSYQGGGAPNRRIQIFTWQGKRTDLLHHFSGKIYSVSTFQKNFSGKSQVLTWIRILRCKHPHRKRRTWQQVADILNREVITTMEGRTWTLQRVQQTAKVG